MVTTCLDQTSILRILGLSPLPIMLLKYRIKYLTKSKKHAPLQFLKVKFKKWVPEGCSCRLCKTYGTSNFYIINLLNIYIYIYIYKLLRTNSVIKNKKEFCDSISIITLYYVGIALLYSVYLQPDITLWYDLDIR